jgi:hypothetical protein
MVKPSLYNGLFCGGTDKISTTPTIHRPLSSKPIIYKTFRPTFFPSHKPSKWIWDFHINHISIISENSGEVKEYRITPIRHNLIYKTLFLAIVSTATIRTFFSWIGDTIITPIWWSLFISWYLVWSKVQICF